MAWITRDYDGHLYIFDTKPERDKECCQWYIPDVGYYFAFEVNMILLPDNLDEKLIDRHITWDDEPIELKS